MTISLRKLPLEVENAIQDLSVRERISLNRATAVLLMRAIEQPARNSDFDEFAGTWSAEEAAEFDAALSAMRAVDPADWPE